MTIDKVKLKALAEAAKSSGADWSDLNINTERMYPAEGALADLHEFATPATVLALLEELSGYQQGAKAEADAADEARAEVRRLKAENEALRATADLQKLLPEISDALEELEIHGQHSDQGYRKLRDWYRKMVLAYRVINGPVFGQEHGELVSQNTWLRSMVEHYAQQHAPLEPIPDSDGWSTRLPGYDLPALLRDAERYRWLRNHADAADWEFLGHQGPESTDQNIDCALTPSGKGEQP